MLTAAKTRKWIDQSMRYAALFLFIGLLTGCGSSTAKKESESIQVSLTASGDINLNKTGMAAPLNVILFELKSYDNFSNSDYFSIYEGKNPAVEREARKIYEVILKPGETRTMDILPGREVRALGIIAAYREINKAGWNKVVELKEVYNKRTWWKKNITKKPPVLNVRLNTLAISTDKMD